MRVDPKSPWRVLDHYRKIFDPDEEFARLRREIHAHPELGFQEQRTSDLIHRSLTSCGIATRRGFGGTGVVGILQNGSSNRSIGLRADMDALPIQERNTFAHASIHAGKMHACGHDGHVAILLAAARQLSQTRDFDGTVYFIFQPAEEGGGGAREMIKDGLLDELSIDAIFGMHNWPGIEAGKFALGYGPVHASSNRFKIMIRGKGAHAAMPEQGTDPILTGVQLIQAFQSIVTRNTSPMHSAVLSVTMINAGEAPNVIPDHCEIQGTVRAFSDIVLDTIETRMRSLTESICEGFGASFDFEFVRHYPPTVNHTRETDFARDVAISLVGDSNVLNFEGTMGAEDFSFFLERVPGCFLHIGNGAAANGTGAAHMPCMLHNPHYDFNDAVTPLGAAFWTTLVSRWLPID